MSYHSSSPATPAISPAIPQTTTLPPRRTSADTAYQIAAALAALLLLVSVAVA
jgi:hypothetical protein